MLMIRGTRQYDKSTWLESILKQTITEFGPASAFYLNGDNILELEKLEIEIQKRLLIDELTTIPNWETALKRLADRGELKDILVVTTESNAIDLRRGTERLPARQSDKLNLPAKQGLQIIPLQKTILLF